MKDRLGREIDYMRISITDRCDLRCKYCMPDPLPDIPHCNIMRYEEFLRICRAALALGMNRFKVTGGEPFARKNAADFIARLKLEPGVKCVTVTTNGTMLSEALPTLKEAGIDGINISLDAIDPEIYKTITGVNRVKDVLSAIKESVKSGIRTKVNSVMLDCNKDQFIPIAKLAQDHVLDVRFIELMPIGQGREFSGPRRDTVLSLLTELYPDLHYVDEKRGNGPAVYYRSRQLKGRIGFISANSHNFCATCNRIRITSTGMLKPCLCYDAVTDLRALLRGGATDRELTEALAKALYEKPSVHCFSKAEDITEHKNMNQIGG